MFIRKKNTSSSTEKDPKRHDAVNILILGLYEHLPNTQGTLSRQATNIKVRFSIRDGQKDPPGSKPRCPSAPRRQAPLSPASSLVQVKVGTPHSTSGSGLWQVVASSPNESKAPDLARQGVTAGNDNFLQGNLKAAYLQELAGRYKHIKQALLSL